MSTIAIPFRLNGFAGDVTVSCEANRNPDAWGCNLLGLPVAVDEMARGFPVCSATIHYGGQGYAALMGWIQLVRDSAAPPGFALDPIALYAEFPTPYCWYGILPTLFDAPFRPTKHRRLSWLAHSFLCFSPGRPSARQVAAVAGFSWGFEIEADEVRLVMPEALPSSAWDAQKPVLEQRCAGWNFLDGYRTA